MRAALLPLIVGALSACAGTSHRSVLTQEGLTDSPPEVRPGVPAPDLGELTWLRGHHLSSLSDEHTYVVELWATWCAACVQEMPALSRLAEKHAGRATVIGVNVMESEDAARVHAFVAAHSEELRYSVAIDTHDSVVTQWLNAAGRSQLPASFVVQGGRIAWVGHPGRVASVLDAAVDGRWDIDAAARRAADERLAARYAARVVHYLEGDDPVRGYRLARALIATLIAHEPEMLLGLAYHILAAPGLPVRDLDVAEMAAVQAMTIADTNPTRTLLRQIRAARHTSPTGRSQR